MLRFEAAKKGGHRSEVLKYIGARDIEIYKSCFFADTHLQGLKIVKSYVANVSCDAKRKVGL